MENFNKEDIQGLIKALEAITNCPCNGAHYQERTETIGSVGDSLDRIADAIAMLAKK